VSEDGGDPPAVSRLERPGTRGYRVLQRAGGRPRTRDRFERQRKQRRIAELLRVTIERHGLTDEVRQRFVCLHWDEIAGKRFASKTEPVAFSDGVLAIAVVSSAWVQEMQFFKARLVASINGWVDANRAWLGPPPLVTDLRFQLGQTRRQRLVDPEHAHRLRMRHLERLRPVREVVPPLASSADRDAILHDTSTVADAELRALIESVRLKWNR
jgi:predicted nucleic acid-binding Zn ribbon protein